MRYIFVLSFFILVTTQSSNALQKHLYTVQQDTLIEFLSNLNLVPFNNLPIDSFISKIPANIQSMIVLGGSRDDMAGMLAISYSDDVYILVRVLEFTHMDPTNPNKLPPATVWDVNLMRKEKVYSIRIYNRGNLLNYLTED